MQINDSVFCNEKKPGGFHKLGFQSFASTRLYLNRRHTKTSVVPKGNMPKK